MAEQLQNWLGMPAHPTDEFLWFRSTKEEATEIRKLYDSILMEGNPFAGKELIQMMDKVRYIAKEESEYFSQGD